MKTPERRAAARRRRRTRPTSARSVQSAPRSPLAFATFQGLIERARRLAAQDHIEAPQAAVALATYALHAYVRTYVLGRMHTRVSGEAHAEDEGVGAFLASFLADDATAEHARHEAAMTSAARVEAEAVAHGNEAPANVASLHLQARRNRALHEIDVLWLVAHEVRGLAPVD